MKMVIGGETEYAMSARDVAGLVVPQELLLGQLFTHAMQTLGYTSTSRRGRFLRNGGLLYVDAGLHLEWSTPETTSPYEVVRYLKAGDQIVQALAASFGEHVLQGPVFGSRASVDYLSGTLWAAHESYMHRVNPDRLPKEFLPFLASRVVFGAGGWDHSATGLRFTLSPRASFISTATDSDSQHVRPLFHTKDEPLGNRKNHRLHVACAESLCSDTSNVLRFGTTALVLAIIELGERPGSMVPLVSPVLALQRFATDEDLRATAPLTHRAAERFAGLRGVSALDIQRHYLTCVERLLGNPEMPEWAESVWTLWKDTLDALEARAPEMDATLDWAIKRRLFARRLAMRGFSWQSLRTWEAVLGQLRMTVNGSRLTLSDVQSLAARDDTMQARMTALEPVLAQHGLSWDGLSALADARNEMFEMDAKFGALGPQGLFNALDASGVLRHRIPAADVGNAVDVPPPDTRARLRGNVVGRLSEAGISYGAEWTLVYDGALNLELDLMDPFETEERWRAVAPAPPHAPVRIPRCLFS